MSRKLKSESAPELDRGSIVESITRFWLTALIIAGILYAAILMISRSDGFRDIVQQRLGMLAGMNVTVGKAWADPLLNLEIQQVDARISTNQALPNLRIGHASLNWRWMALLRGAGWPFDKLEAENVDIRFVMSTNNVWQPFPALHDMLAPWVKLTGSESSSTNMPATETMRDLGVKLSISNGSIRWVSAEPDEPPLALVEGIEFLSDSIQPLNKELMWFDMSIRRAETGEIEWLSGYSLEWIRTSEKDIPVKQSGQLLAEEQRIWQHQILHGK